MPSSPGTSRRTAWLVKAAHIALMAAIFLCGVYGFGHGLVESGQDIRYGLASRDWPGKLGTIESSLVEKGGRGNRTPRIRYRYEVGGRTLHGERIGTRTAYDDAYGVVAAYPAGAEVLVYHDPAGAVAVLERGVGAGDFVRFGFMLLAGAAVLLLTGALLHLMVTMPAIEHLAQWRALRPAEYRDRRANREQFERRLRADMAMEAEIAERLRKQAARRRR